MDSEGRFCVQCGQMIEEGSAFCGNCGYRLPESPSCVNPQPGLPFNPPNMAARPLAPAVGFAARSARKTGLIWGLIAGAVVLSIAAYFIFTAVASSSNREPFSAVERFEKAFNELDYNGLMDSMDPRVVDTMMDVSASLGETFGIDISSDVLRSVMPLIADYLSSYAADYWEDAGISMTMTATELSTEMVRDDKAKIVCRIEISSSDGATEVIEETINTVKVDGKWYIALF
jgi:hypothetical protein